MQYVEVLAPTIVVALVFWVVIRALMNADRSERRAEAEADARLAESRAQAPEQPAATDLPGAPGTENRENGRDPQES